MYCNNCKFRIQEFSKFCSSCGEIVSEITDEVIERPSKEPLDLVTRADRPSIISFIFTVLLVIILIIYPLREISEYITFILFAIKNDVDTAYNIVYLGITDSSRNQRVMLTTAQLLIKDGPIAITALLVMVFVFLYLGETVSYFKKLKLFNQKINANEFNTCPSCSHDQVHFHATSCPKCGSPDVNMYIKEMQRNFGVNFVLFVTIMILILQNIK